MAMDNIFGRGKKALAIILRAAFGAGALLSAFFPFSAVRTASPLTAAEGQAKAIVLGEDIFVRAPFANCHASTIAETPAGLVAAWFGGTKEGSPDVKIWVSRHDGASWSAPEEAGAGTGPGGERLPCWNPVLFQLREGPLLLFYKVGRSPSSWWGMMRTSGDSGRTWTELRRLPDGILGPAKNHPIEFPDGTILCGSSTEHDGWRVHFEWTPDAGRTWARTGDLNDGRSFGLIQPALLQTGGEGVIALMRSNAGRIYEARTADGGRTWTRPVPLELPNPNSGIDAVTLRDGWHLLVFNPSTSSRSPLSVALSKDGRTWKTIMDLENEKGQEFSYPAVVQSACGRVHITYTWKRLRIRHVVLDPGRF